jgi:hypothetical protein
MLRLSEGREIAIAAGDVFPLQAATSARKSA